jgi:hypothetical protein
MSDDIFHKIIHTAEWPFLHLVPAGTRTWIAKELVWIENPDNRAKAAGVVITVIEDLKKAEPVVEAVGKLTGEGPVADFLVAGLERIGTKVEDLAKLEKAADEGDAGAKITLGQTRLTLAGEGLRAVLASDVRLKGVTTFMGKELTTLEQVEALLPSDLQSPAQLALKVGKAAGLVA